jgi:hypothetical protein
MRYFDWTGKNRPLSEEEFNELASTDRGLREMRYPYKYQRSDDKRLTGMYVTYKHYENVREFSEEQHKRATELYEKKRLAHLEETKQRGVLTFVGMGMEFEPTLPNGIGNYRIRCFFIDKKGETFFMEIHPYYNEKRNGCNERGFYGEIGFKSLDDRNFARYNELCEKYERELGKWWWNRITHEQHEELENLHFPKYERIESGKPFTEEGILDYVNGRFGTDFKSILYDYCYLGHDDIQFNPSRC